jgi:hypothetical protein
MSDGKTGAVGVGVGVGVVVSVADGVDAGGATTVPSALMYSYIESLWLPPHFWVASPSQGMLHPALPSGATPPPFEKALPQ